MKQKPTPRNARRGRARDPDAALVATVRLTGGRRLKKALKRACAALLEVDRSMAAIRASATIGSRSIV